MTSQQLKEEFEEAAGVDQIFIPQKDKGFAECLTQTESLNSLKCCRQQIKTTKNTECCNYCCGVKQSHHSKIWFQDGVIVQ